MLFRSHPINGNGIKKFANGDIYEGEFKDGKMNGEGVYYFSNGDKYEGEYINNTISGKGKSKINIRKIFLC